MEGALLLGRHLKMDTPVQPHFTFHDVARVCISCNILVLVSLGKNPARIEGPAQAPQKRLHLA